MNKIVAYGAFIILIGIIFILVTIQIEGNSQSHSHLLTIGLKLLGHLGVALISIGLIGILIESRDWQKYFQERIADTILQRDYLKRLDPAELLQLQTNTLKAYFKIDDLEREESLFNFFHTKIQVLLSSPYREDLDGIFTITASEDKKTLFLEEKISYKCRKVGDSTLEKIHWETRKKREDDKLEAFRITVRIPRNFYQSPEFKTRFPELSKAQRERIFDMADNADGKLVSNDNQKDLGYSLSLSEYKGIDGLDIEIYIKYSALANKDFKWTMSEPTKNFKVTINYPHDQRLDVTIIGIDRQDYFQERRLGLYSLRYDSWLLPTTGLVFHLS